MSKIDIALIERVERLEREVRSLRAAFRFQKKVIASRVYIAEVAQKFGVSTETVRKMQFEFAGLFKIKKQTPAGRIYFERTEYNKWLEGKSDKPKRRGLIRRTKRET